VKKQHITYALALLTVALALTGAAAPAHAQDKKPNIVFMLTDNLGYGELGSYGGGILRGAPTPHIDHLATEGLRLLNFNVEAMCTPSRSALMTGRFSIRSGTYAVPLGGVPDGLTQWEVTIVELLSAQGYAPACGANGISEPPRTDSLHIRDSTSGMASRARTTRASGPR
jgi:arylsulfatase